MKVRIKLEAQDTTGNVMVIEDVERTAALKAESVILMAFANKLRVVVNIYCESREVSFRVAHYLETVTINWDLEERLDPVGQFRYETCAARRNDA